MKLYYSYDMNIESAYVITIKGNERSEIQSKRCQESCAKVDMPVKIWDAYDGTKSGKIVEPERLKNDSIMNSLKLTDHYMTKGETACALSHISLWSHCIQIDKPIVIFEHDAIAIKKFSQMQAFNSICYLGGREWVKDGWGIFPIPPHSSDGPNYHFICRAHAYAIDPVVAKNMIAHVISKGICAPLDIMMRADLFNISHNGVYAYDDPEGTTIHERAESGRTTNRVDAKDWC